MISSTVLLLALFIQTLRKHISTNIWSAQHLNAGEIIEQASPIMTSIEIQKY